MLVKEFNEAVQGARVIALNPYLAQILPALIHVEKAAETNATVAKYVEQLRALIATPDFALDQRATEKFLQKFGETHFLVLCVERGLRLERIPEQSTPTPDFRLLAAGAEAHFEVKTLSVVGGERGIATTIQQAGDAVDSIDAQLKKRNIGIGVAPVSPFGGGASVQKVIDVLLEKMRQNIKSGQYARPNTFLAIDLCMLSPVPGGKGALRPRFPDYHVDGAQISGPLWMAAFGQPTTEVFDFVDFDGAPNTKGPFHKQGVLADPAFADIKGLVFVVHPWGRPAEFWSLIRSHDVLSAIATSAGGLLRPLSGDVWNDELDTNAAAL